MDNRYGDNRYGDERARSRASERGGYGRGRGGEGDRGFLDRAGDEVRSWFGDDEAERRREADERRWESERRMSGGRGDDNYTYAGPGGTAGGWGNQAGDSWNRERPGTAGSYGAFGGRGERPDRSNQRYGESASGGGEIGAPEVFGEPYPGGTSGFGGAPDHGRRFDRVDAGSTGTHGAHPMSSPVGGAYGGGYGIGASGESGGSARYAAYSRGGGTGRSGRSEHDPHYSEWRDRQIESLDRDYDEYRREHQSRFEQDFGDWRSKRGEQRQFLSRVTEHMEVTGSDGETIGTVDKILGERIVLAKKDENAGGIHHSIPCSWIERVEDKVFVTKSKDEAMREWRAEDRNRALFEPEDSGSEGPHVLNRSFSGTY
jgi:hypothetical protein